MQFRSLVRVATLGTVAAMALMPAVGMAQAQSQGTAPDAGQPTGVPAPSTGEDPSPDIVVTGTSIRGIAPVGSESISLSRGDIQKTGAITTSQLFATIPQVQAFGTRPRTSSGFGGVNLGPDIRGLGEGRTLTLINGHRLVKQGISQSDADPSGIPPAAIERIEIVPDGTSSVYGSDAVAGVVNVILRHNLNGVDVQGTYGIASGYDEANANIAVGKTWSSGSLLVAYQYAQNSALGGNKRDYNSADLSSRGGPDTRTTQSPQPNIVVGGVNYAYPGLVANTSNRYDQADYSDIIPEERRHSVVATFDQKVGDRVNLFADVEYSDRRVLPRFPISTGSYTINNTNPFFVAPPGTGATSETVNFSFANIVFPYTQNPESLKNLNVSGGFDADLFGDFKAQAFGTFGWSKTIATQGLGSIDGGRAAAAAAGTTTATALDFFTNRTNPSVLAFISDRSTPAISTQRLYEGVGKIDGTLFQLPGGGVKLAVGGGYRVETYDATVYDATRSGTQLPGFQLFGNGTRNIWSAFGEVFIPLFSDVNARPGLKELSVSASGRYDNYNTFGDTVNPKVGVTYAPIAGLRFKGSYGTSFRAPAQSDSNAVDTRVDVIPNLSAPGALTPPGPGTYNTLVLAGGNPNLRPEKSTSYSFGLELTPKLIQNLRGSVTYFNVKIDDLIGGPYGQAFSNPAYRQYYILNPTLAQIAQYTNGVRFNYGGNDPSILNNIQILDLFNRYNLGTRRVSGIDYDVAYNYPITDGALSLGVAGTTYINYETQSPGSAPTDNLKTGQVRWRLRGSVGARKGPVDASVFVNYTGNYENPTATNTAGRQVGQTVGSFTTIDLNFAIDLPKLARGRIQPQLLINAENIFDEDPPFYNGFIPAGDGTLGGFNYQLANPLGRFVQMGLRFRY